MSDKADVPESDEVMRNVNRWTRVSELDEFWTALKSHEAIDRAWLTEWQARVMSVLKGEERPTA